MLRDKPRLKGLYRNVFLSLEENDVAEHGAVREACIGKQQIGIEPVVKAEFEQLGIKAVLPQRRNAEIAAVADRLIDLIAERLHHFAGNAASFESAEVNEMVRLVLDDGKTALESVQLQNNKYYGTI